MTQTTFAVTTGDNDDGGKYAHTSWPPNGGTFTALSSGREYVAKNHLSGSSYEQYWMCIRWDTSSIPDTDTITAAELRLYLVAAETVDTHGTYSLQGGWYDYGGVAMVAGDWVEFETSPIFTADLGSLTGDAVNVFTITDLTGISKTGHTGIRLNLSSGTPPLDAVNGDGVRPAAYDDATFQEPRLVVTHSAVVPTSITTNVTVNY